MTAADQCNGHGRGRVRGADLWIAGHGHWTAIARDLGHVVACLNLAAARLRYIAGTQWSMRRYMNMDPLHDAKNDQTGAAVA